MDDARAAAEMLLLGSSVKVAPIVAWDGQPIGDGKPGPVTKNCWQCGTRTPHRHRTSLSPYLTAKVFDGTHTVTAI